MASFCRIGSPEFHGHPDLVRRSAPVSAHSGSLGVLLPSTSSLLFLPCFGLEHRLDFCLNFPLVAAGTGTLVLLPEWHGLISHPRQELSWCWVDPAATCQALISPAPRLQVPCPGICIWTYPATDQAQECPPVCKDRSLKSVSFFQTLFLPCPGSCSPPFRATDTSVGSWVR